MYISCTNCQTKFIALKEQIGLNGRKVKCSKCQHIWYYKPDYSAIKLTDFDEVEKIPVITPIKYGAQKNNSIGLPALLPPRNDGIKISSFVWFSILALISLILFENNLRSFFRYHELKIEDIKITKGEDITKVLYKITNPSGYTTIIPFVRVTVKERSLSLPDTYISHKLNLSINPYQTINMEMELKERYQEVECLDMTVVSKIELLF